MVIRIDQSDEAPIYLQIRDQIIEGVARGELSSGDSLPSVRQLAADLGINLHTVNKAYAVLRDEGYVAMRGRKGAFIANAQSIGRAKPSDDRRRANGEWDLPSGARTPRARWHARKLYGHREIPGRACLRDRRSLK